MDVNGDGTVDASEAQAVIERRMERRRSRWNHEGGERGRGMERMLRRFDADNDGKVTRAEMEAWVAQRFARMDLDGDGKITDADLPPIMRGLNVLSSDTPMEGRGRHRRMMRMIRMLRRANTNNDGEVTKAEVLAAAAKRFERFDRNKDGVIDKSDFEMLRNEMTDYRVKRFFHRFGAAQAGKLTLEQYTKVRSERFAKMDRNNDGVITPDERGGRGWGRHYGRDDDRGHHRGHWQRSPGGSDDDDRGRQGGPGGGRRL
jgi:Ca2+-binding EF-hand superfamily protein